VPIPHFVAKLNKRYLNRFARQLAGHGPFVELEHVGRRSGAVYRTPLMAFRSGGTVTIALTYGPDVDWLRNVRAGEGCRLHLGGRMLRLGAPRRLATQQGLRRMPLGPKQILPLTGTRDFVELDVISERPFTGW
jgi:deazaflavin-dependent oxidoreductase (nitroreductase family)